MKASLRLIIALAAALAAGQAYAEYATERNIAYTTRSDDYSQQQCRLDVYYPEGAVGAPVVVWFHGGGLTGGKRSLPKQLRECGYVVVGVGYRLLPQATIDDCIDDAAAAVAWTFANAGRYGGDRSKIFVAGHSAGAYLTSMIGLDRRWLSRYGVEADSIAALFPFSGQAITHFARRGAMGIGPLQAVVDEYAPLYHVRPDCPPYIIITGDAEQEMNGRYEENLYMWRMMKLVGHPNVAIYKLDGYNHGAMAAPAFHILRRHIDAVCPSARR